MTTNMKISLFRKPKFIVLAIAFLTSLVLFTSAGSLFSNKDIVYLAVAGPTEPDNVSGREMVQGIQLYLDRLNREGGVNGKKVELEIYNDENDPEVAREVATEIAESSSALAVLGHFYSSTSLAGGEIYQRAGIPAISASATADLVTQSDWYSRVIFSNHLQAKFIANYVSRVLKQPNASIIYSDGDYGQTLRESFSNTFLDLGGNIAYQWAIDVDAPDFLQQQQQIIADLQAKDKPPGMIFFATHNSDVVDLIVQMKRQQLEYEAIGSDSLGSVAFAQKFCLIPRRTSAAWLFFRRYLCRIAHYL